MRRAKFLGGLLCDKPLSPRRFIKIVMARPMHHQTLRRGNFAATPTINCPMGDVTQGDKSSGGGHLQNCRVT